MKSQKSWMIAFAVVLAICAFGVIALVMENGNTRDATADEIAAAQVYIPDWDALAFPGVGETIKDRILSQCEYAQETEVGENAYASYTSATVSDYLYQCQELQQILVGEDNILYISYITVGDGQAVLAYDDAGLVELSVYNAETDALYYQTADARKMWLNFRGTAE